MWEARAAPGRVADLERWARSVTAGRDADIYRGRADSAGLVVILLHPPAGAAAGRAAAEDAADGPLPAPPADLVVGRVSAWPFERIATAEPQKEARANHE